MMSRRPTPKNAGSSAGIAGEVVLEDKVEYLEHTLKTFRAEVDLKMTIIEQILTTRNEQFLVQKKLLEREHALYESVMTHWKNTADLAASGLSIKFSDGGVDMDLLDFVQDESEASQAAKRTAASARRGRRKRLKTQFDTRVPGGSDTEEVYTDLGLGSGMVVEEVSFDPSSNISMTAGHREGESEEDDSDSAERKVFIEVYSPEADHGKFGDKSSNPIWKHYMREENGKSALCKLCDDQGIQRILKLQEGSTSTLHRHLRFKHKEMVETKPPPQPRQHHQQETTTEFTIIPPRMSVDGSRRTQSPIWNYFTKFKDGDVNKARCNVCYKEGTLTIHKISDGSTSRFHAHLKRAHRIDTKVTPNPAGMDLLDDLQGDESHLDGLDIQGPFIDNQKHEPDQT